MAEGPIPDSMIKAYALDPDLELTQRERWAFKKIIRALDNAYLRLNSEQAKNKAKKPPRRQ